MSEKKKKRTRHKKSVGAPKTNVFVSEQNKKNPPKKPGKVGAPTKYKSEYCQMLVDHQAGGFSFDTFAAVISVNPDSLYTWAKKHKDFSDAKKRAYIVCMHWWENKGIIGLESPAQSWTPTMLIYNMKCRFPKQWRDDPRGLDNSEGDVDEDKDFEAEW